MIVCLILDSAIAASRRRPTDSLGGDNLDQLNKNESDDFEHLLINGQVAGLINGGFFPQTADSDFQLK